MSAKVEDNLTGDLLEQGFGFKVVATWRADCGTFPNPRLETARVGEDGLLVAQCNHCFNKHCLVRRFLRTVNTRKVEE